MNILIKKVVILLFTGILLPSYCHAQIITTIAGGGTAGLGDGGQATDCELINPIGIAVDGSGNIYISDRDHNRIRKINAAGVVVTIAGTGAAGFSGDGGPATDAEIDKPYGLAVDNIGNIYFADGGNIRIRKISTSGHIGTIAGTGSLVYNGDNIPATTANLGGVSGITLDNVGNIYITDADNRIRKINSSGTIITIAGIGTTGYGGDNGPATLAKLNTPYAITLDGAGSVYFCDEYNHRVRKIDASGIISTIAGTGGIGFSGDGSPATQAQLNRPLGVAVDGTGCIYISDAFNNRVRKIGSTGFISTIAGNGISGFSGDGGPATNAPIVSPVGIAFDLSSNLLVVDFGNDRIRKISGVVSVKDIHQTAAQLDLQLYPNPNSGDFYATVTSVIDEPASIVISDITGRKITEVDGSTNKSMSFHIDCPTGIYILTITTRNIRVSEKINVIK